MQDYLAEVSSMGLTAVLLGDNHLEDIFLAAVELTRIDFDFLHDGLGFPGVSRVRLVLFVYVPVKDLAAFTNWYNCPKLRIFRPHGLQTRPENRRESCTNGDPTYCKSRIVGHQSKPAVSTA